MATLDAHRREGEMASERIVLHMVDEGSGRPVVLLHGFPDSSALWRHQSPAPVDAGFRTIAPDLRGFGRSPRPERVDDYAVTMVVGDVLALMDDLGVKQADVVGHDWGSAVGWILAAIAPERVRRSSPCPWAIPPSAATWASNSGGRGDTSASRAPATGSLSMPPSD